MKTKKRQTDRQMIGRTKRQTARQKKMRQNRQDKINIDFPTHFYKIKMTMRKTRNWQLSVAEPIMLAMTDGQSNILCRNAFTCYYEV